MVPQRWGLSPLQALLDRGWRIDKESPSNGGNARGASFINVETRYQLGGNYLVTCLCPKFMVRHRVINL